MNIWGEGVLDKNTIGYKVWMNHLVSKLPSDKPFSPVQSVDYIE